MRKLTVAVLLLCLVGAFGFWLANTPEVSARRPTCRPGEGRIRSITGTDPAAGAAMIVTVPAGVLWRFISMNVTLVTDANVAARNAHFFFDDGANIYLRCTNDQGQAENLTQIYAVANGIHMGFASPNIQSIPCPSDLFLPAGHRIREGTNNFQAGDNWGAPQLLVEQCSAR